MWETKTFEELYLEPSRNGIYKPKEFHGRGCKIVNMGELFAYDFVGQQDMKRVELNEKELERDTLRDGDILFGRRSLVESGAGKSSIVKNLNEPTTYESSVIRLRLNQKYSNPYFYYYWLLSPSGKGAIASIVTGANVKGIKSSDLKNIVVPTPPLPTQNKIVGILSAYDDLIENNLKRIKLLEEMAQITYEEWFVRLRFHGHESTPINTETGLPEGWSNREVGSFGQLKGGKQLTKDRFVDKGNVPVFGGAGVMGRTDVKNASGYVISVGRVGAYCGKFVAHRGDAWINNNASYFILNTNTYPEWFFITLKNLDLENIRKGAAQPFVSNSDIEKLSILYSGDALTLAFQQIISPIFHAIENYHTQNERLREARDILLPRLMTGMIDVESYDPAQLLKEAA